MRIAVTPAPQRRSNLFQVMGFELLLYYLGVLLVVLAMGGITAMSLEASFMKGFWLTFAAVATVALLSLGASRLLRAKPHSPVAIEVGAEGLVLEYESGPLMLPMARMVHVIANGNQLTIKARGMQSVDVLARSATAANAILDDFEQLRRAYTHNAADKALSVAKHASNSHAERVAKLTSQSGSYRNLGLSPDDLAALLVCGKAAPRHRIAAADALLHLDPKLAQSSLTATRGQTLNRHLRIALSAVESGELESHTIEQADRWFGQNNR